MHGWTQLDAIEQAVAAEGARLWLPAQVHALVCQPAHARALALGMGLMALNQLTAINTVMYYGTTILNDLPGVRTEPQPNVHPTKPAVKAGGLCCVRTRRAAATFAALLRLESEGTVPPPGLVCRTRDALAVNVGCNVAQLLGVMVAVVQMDSLGRRYLALRSLGGVVISLLALVAAFAVPSLRYAAVPALLLYLVAFGTGLSAVPWVVNAEIYPMHLRAVATGTF
jgi:hypothetical protein